MRISRATTWLTGAVAATALLGGCATSDRYDSNANREAVDDSTVAANVKAALVQDPTTRASNISVNTMHGVVELTGFVDTPEQRHEAARVAGNVAGVRSVDNELHVNSPNGSPAVVGSAMSDEAITARVQAALASDTGTQGAQIKVSTYRGVVQLAGFVPSNSVRDEAGNVAGSVQGVRSVDNDLRLAP
jgi:hyperosmotically inducible protein